MSNQRAKELRVAKLKAFLIKWDEMREKIKGIVEEMEDELRGNIIKAMPIIPDNDEDEANELKTGNTE